MDDGLNELDPCVDHHIQWDEDKEGQDLEENVWNAGNLRKSAKFEVLYFLGKSLKKYWIHHFWGNLKLRKLDIELVLNLTKF